MKSLIYLTTSSLSLLTSAHLTYDSQSHSLTCPTTSGTFCTGSSSTLLVTCTGSIGALSACPSGTTCTQTSPSSGDAKCAAPQWGYYGNATTTHSSDEPCVLDAHSKEDCDCDDTTSTSTTSKAPVPVLPSTMSTATLSTSRASNATLTATLTRTRTSTVVVPRPTGHAAGTGTGTGYANPTHRVTTLNSSWKPTLPAPTSSSTPSTTFSPVLATGAAADVRVPVVGAAAVVGLVVLMI